MEVALDRVRRQVSGSIDAYLKTVLNNFKGQMTTGIPALKIPKLDPFNVKDQSIRKKDSKVDIDLKMTQLSVTGLSKFTITNLKLDLNNLRFTFGLRIPKMTIKGLYDLDGKMFNIFPLYGDGPFSISVSALSISTSAAVSINANGIGTLAEPPHLDVSFRSVRIHFRNLLGGLSNVLNNIISSLARPIFDKMKPKLMASLKKSMFKILNKKLSTVDITKFLG